MAIENDIVSALLRDKTFTPCIEVGVNEGFFVDDEMKEIYAFTLEHWKKYGAFPTEAVLKEKFPKFKPVKVEEPLRYYCEELYRKYRANVVKEGLRKIAPMLSGKSEEAISQLEQLQLKLQETKKDKDKSLMESRPARKELYLKRKKEGGISGLIFNLPTLDMGLGGIHEEDFLLISGRQKVGKSFLLCFVAAELFRQGKRVLFITKEMSIAAIQTRVECLMFHLPYTRFKQAKLVPEEEKHYFESLDKMTGGNLTFVQDVSTVGGLVAKAKEFKPDAVILDGLYLLEDPRAKALWEKITYISRDLKRATQLLKVPIIATTQLNRGTNAKKGPSMENLSYADALGQDVDAAIGLYQTEEMKADKEMFLKVMGAREADKLVMKLVWDLDKMIIKEAVLDRKAKKELAEMSDDDFLEGDPKF